MAILQSANLALRFFLELAALAAFGYWGFRTGDSAIMKWGFGIGVPLLAAVFWGTFESPRAVVNLSASLRLILELAYFGLAVASLYISGQPNLAWVFGGILVINEILRLVWRQ